MRETLFYDSIGCKQALPIFEELVNAGQEPVGEDYPPTELEYVVGSLRSRPGRSAREASVSAPAHLPEREEEGERPARERPAREQAAASIFHSSNQVLVSCEFRHTGPGVSEAELLECTVAPRGLGTSATTSCFDLKEGQTCGHKALPILRRPPTSTSLARISRSLLSFATTLSTACARTSSAAGLKVRPGASPPAPGRLLSLLRPRRKLRQGCNCRSGSYLRPAVSAAPARRPAA